MMNELGQNGVTKWQQPRRSRAPILLGNGACLTVTDEMRLHGARLIAANTYDGGDPAASTSEDIDASLAETILRAMLAVSVLGVAHEPQSEPWPSEPVA